MPISNVWWIHAALFIGLPAAGRAALTVQCVGNETELRAALAAAGGSSPDDREVRLVRRVYFNGTTEFVAQLGSLTGAFSLSGGWSPGCSTRIDDPRATVFDAQGLSRVLVLRRDGVSGNRTPPIAVSNLTLRNGRAGDAPIGLHIANAFGSVEVDDLIVHGHRATASTAYAGTAITLQTSNGSRIGLRNVLAYDNAGVFGSGSQPLFDVMLNSFTPEVEHQFIITNTTIDAAASASALLLYSTNTRYELFNNILRGEVRYDWTGGVAPLLRVRQVFNHMPAALFNTPPVIDLDVGNDAGDPQLDPVTFEPRPGSPAIDSGLGAPPGGQSATDVYGRPRVAFTYIDRGALESQVSPDTLFRDGFE
ncbi:MAG: hypothetical protein J0L88_04610 [Xanthomonadales bacterium]|nr:hypothetical protein [Xanthomonadales bacterium]